MGIHTQLTFTWVHIIWPISWRLSSFLFLALPKTNHYKEAFSLTQEWINHERKAESSFLFLSICVKVTLWKMVFFCFVSHYVFFISSALSFQRSQKSALSRKIWELQMRAMSVLLKFSSSHVKHFFREMDEIDFNYTFVNPIYFKYDFCLCSI